MFHDSSVSFPAICLFFSSLSYYTFQSYISTFNNQGAYEAKPWPWSHQPPLLPSDQNNSSYCQHPTDLVNCQKLT